MEEAKPHADTSLALSTPQSHGLVRTPANVILAHCRTHQSAILATNTHRVLRATLFAFSSDDAMTGLIAS